jgi:hypothetical protein
MKIRVDYEDGHYWAVPYTDGHAAVGLSFVEVTDQWWRDYQKFREASQGWHNGLSRLSNIQYAKDNPNDEFAQAFARDMT